MSFKMTAGGLAVFLFSVSAVRGQTGWAVTYPSAQICALAGSTVDIRCSFTSLFAVRETFWFAKGGDAAPVDLTTDAEYAGRVEYRCDKNDCTLRIRDVRESDSAQYKFRFTTNQPGGRFTGSAGVTLSVTALQVRAHKIAARVHSVHAVLYCDSTCQLPGPPSYFWYITGQSSIKGQTKEGISYENNFAYKDSYACAVRGFEDFASRPVCAHNNYCNIVSYSRRSICALRGSSVDISCNYFGNEAGLYVAYKFWFSPERSHRWQNPSEPEDLTRDSQYAGRVQFRASGGVATLSITGLRESDSAQYRFKFRAQRFEWRSSLPGTTLTVTALHVQVTKLSFTEAELRCQSSCSPAGGLSYVWFKNGGVVRGVTFSYRGQFQPGDDVSCAFKGYESYRSPSVYGPKSVTVSVSPSAEIVEGSSVTLTCSSDANPAAKYTWYKNGKVTSLSKDPQLVFRSIQSSDSGEYYCTAENQLGTRTSEYISINVKYAPKLPSVSVSPSAEIVEGSSVTLTCSSDANPAAKYTWYKKGKVTSLSKDPQLVFRSIQSSDSGEYYCTAENQLGTRTSGNISINVKYAPKLPSVSVSPSAEIVEGSSVTLTCSSDANPAANYTWYREDGKVLQQPGGVHHFTSISSEDRGIYYCKSENQHGQRTSKPLFVDVLYAPKLPSVSVSPSAEIVEGSSVTLTCSSDANPAANYTWYKEDEDSPKASGQIFTITDFRAEHSGNYYCEAENEIGRHNSTVCLTLVTGNSTIIIVVVTLTLVVLILILILLLCRWIRKRKSPDSSSEPEQSTKLNSAPDYQSISKSVTAEKTDDAEEQENLM